MATKRNPEEREQKAPASSASSAATDRSTDGASSAADPMSDLDDTQGRLQELATEYYKNLSETASELSRQAANIFHMGSDAVQRNTWESIGIAAGVGLVIGFLID